MWFSSYVRGQTNRQTYILITALHFTVENPKVIGLRLRRRDVVLLPKNRWLVKKPTFVVLNANFDVETNYIFILPNGKQFH